MNLSIKIDEEQLSQFSSDVQSLWVKPIPTIESIPSPIEFLREYVNLSQPVLIKNAFPIFTLDDLLVKEASISAQVTSSTNGMNEAQEDEVILNVDVTPDGHGDTIRIVDGEKMFVMPEVKEMSLTALKNELRKEDESEHDGEGGDRSKEDEYGRRTFCSAHSSGKDGDHSVEDTSAVFYYSRQNDCLRKEVEPLASLFPEHIPFASEAFNARPDAVNLWIGDERSVSSMHKDHYENIFCVSSGQKVFTVCPPADSLFLEETEFPSGTFRQTDSNWVVDVQTKSDAESDTEDIERVRWIEADVERVMEPESSQSRQEYLGKFPLLQYTHPVRVYVESGDMLYLPALWYHRVTQTCETVAVNYWYDMRFDSPNWCYFNFLQHLSGEVIDNDETERECDEILTR
mmetsp:Transcript_14/g.20  ORF Transcript_14/g.20 Transcript_14/m.20 type:complete len:402 (-) Transcript_14:1317-2522(-)